MTQGVLFVIIGVVLAVGCGSGEPETTPTTAVPPVTTSMAPASTTTEVATTSSTTPTTVASERFEIIDGQFQGPETFAVVVGETFVIEVVSDAAGELHVHGFDLIFELAADEPTRVEFVASGPGVFEVELEGSHTHLFEVEVRD